MLTPQHCYSTSGDFMFGKLLAACTILCLAFVSYDASAQSYNTGSQTCTQNYSLYDYYTNGRYTHSSWDADGVTCTDNGGGFNDGGGYDDGGIIGPDVGEASTLSKAPNNPYNQNPATCTSDAYGRISHAAGDFTGWRTANGKTFQWTGRGERITFVYDDGGTEDYIWINGSSIVITDPSKFLAPIPNTLKCPKP
jgi:hypothetical protein